MRVLPLLMMGEPFRHLLVTTLGTTWAVVPEVYNVFTDWYGLERPSETIGVQPPQEIWLISTNKAWEGARGALYAWSAAIGVNLVPHLINEPDLSRKEDIAEMRELIFRVVLLASERAEFLSCSLAGGRKTMSADLQEAAGIFGCHLLIHVLSNGSPADWPNAFARPSADFFIRPLPVDCQLWLTPVVQEGNPRADFLDVPWREFEVVLSKRFPPTGECRSVNLTTEVRERQRDAGLLSNFINQIERDEAHENWRSLYRLPPRIIQRLREVSLSEEHRGLIRRLPKAELHSHIGGFLTLEQQRDVARHIWEALSSEEKRLALKGIRLLDWGCPLASWREGLRRGNRAANVAAVFHCLTLKEIENILYPPGNLRLGLNRGHPLGFGAYELPGELSGSAVLGHPAALIPTARAILENCRADNIQYLELRGSPHKYAPNDPVGWLTRLDHSLRQSRFIDDPDIRFIWIADRRQVELLNAIIDHALSARNELDGFLVGIDLAGDEAVQQPEGLAPYFRPAFEACLSITIHAGEGKSAENIWQAAYHLHADRIGHGLSLAENKGLLTRFRDRKICLEVCPTSNREVVGYRDPQIPESIDYGDYPLMQLWKSGVPLTLCTDNIGISRTTLTSEYVAASRMCGGLSLWDALGMMKMGFVHAFSCAANREQTLKKADRQMHAEILNWAKTWRQH